MFIYECMNPAHFDPAHLDVLHDIKWCPYDRGVIAVEKWVWHGKPHLMKSRDDAKLTVHLRGGEKKLSITGKRGAATTPTSTPTCNNCEAKLVFIPSTQPMDRSASLKDMLIGWSSDRGPSI